MTTDRAMELARELRNTLLKAFDYRRKTAPNWIALGAPEPYDMDEIIADVIRRAVEEERERWKSEVEQLRVQLAGVSVAAWGGTSETQVATQGDYGWSVPYEDVLRLRREHDRLAALLGEVLRRLGIYADQLAAMEEPDDAT